MNHFEIAGIHVRDSSVRSRAKLTGVAMAFLLQDPERDRKVVNLPELVSATSMGLKTVKLAIEDLSAAGFLRGSTTEGWTYSDQFLEMPKHHHSDTCWRCRTRTTTWAYGCPLCWECAEVVGICANCGLSIEDPALCHCTQHQPGGFMSTVLHKDASSNFAIVTTADSEEEFRGQFASALTEMIESKRYDGDWPFHLNGWIEQATEVLCKYRDYKSKVVERRTIIAGVLDPDAAVLTVNEFGRAPSEESAPT